MLRVYQILVSIFILYTHLTIRVKTENFDNPRHVDRSKMIFVTRVKALPKDKLILVVYR